MTPVENHDQRASDHEHLVIWERELTLSLFLAVSERRFMIGLWPMFGVLSLPIVIVETYGIVLMAPFIPTFGLLRVKKPVSQNRKVQAHKQD